MAEALYLLQAYWPFVLAVLIAGVAVGWWAEGVRDQADAANWLEGGSDEP